MVRIEQRLNRLRAIGSKLEEITPTPRDFPAQTYEEIRLWHRRKWDQFARVRSRLIEQANA